MTKTRIQSRGFWAVPLAILIAAVPAVCATARETSADVGDTARTSVGVAATAGERAPVPVLGESPAIPASVCCVRFICPSDHSVRSVWCKGGGTSIGDAVQRCETSCGEACDSTDLICTR
jgi:hypothetical protein